MGKRPDRRGANGRGVYTSRARVAPEEALTAWQALHPWRVTYIVAQHRRMEGLADEDDRGSGLAMTAPAQAMAGAEFDATQAMRGLAMLTFT
jgi:hypothetical protein